MKIQNMQNLFVDVLNSRDLSRAGDLFQIDDNLIVTDLSTLIRQIETISSAHDFNQKINDQSVVEICLTKIVSAIRETNSIEKHSKALVSLLESCLQHDLRPSKLKDEDPPHAKIANEVIGLVFLNHDKKAIMQSAVPIAIKFLLRGNKELSRNLSSYLSLAAINNAEILAQNLSLIIDSVISGNFTLARVLPKIYPIRKEPIHDHLMSLLSLLPKCANPEKLSLLSLFQLVSKNEPKLLESNLPELSECLETPQTAYQTIQVFLNMAQVNAKPFLEYVQKVVIACSLQQGMLSTASQFLSLIGKLDIDKACDCLYFLTYQLSKSDLSTTIVILKEIKSIAEVFPQILPNFLNEILIQTKNSSSNTVQSYLKQLNNIAEQVNSSGSMVQVNFDQNGSSLFGNLNQYSNNFNFNHLNTTYDLIPSQQAKNNSSSNFKLNSSNFKLPTSNYNSYKIVNTININPNNELLHRSIPRLHYYYGSSSTHRIIGKQLSCSSNGVHHSLTNCSKNNSNHLDEHHCSADSITTNRGSNQLNPHSLTHNSSPSSSSNQNMLNFRNSRPEMQMMNIYHNNNTFNGERLTNTTTNFIGNGIYSSTSNSKTFIGNSLLPSNNANSKQYILDNPQLLQLSSSSSFTNPTQHQNNFMSYSLNQKSYTLQNNYYNYEYRDGIKQFCTKHIDKIKVYMERVNVRIQLPVKCTVEERKSRKLNKLQLHFLCQIKESHCLFSKNFFTIKTKNARVWLHLMFLDLQAKADEPLYTSAPAVSLLKNCFDALKDTYKENSSSNNKNFLTLVTSSFPSVKDQDELIFELKNERYYDVFEFNAMLGWCCFLCNHPDKINDFGDVKDGNPIIQGQLKEKRGKWKLFRRWKKQRYFTLTGLNLSYRDKDKSTDIGEILSVRAISSRNRSIPKCFEIFTNENKTFVFKAGKYTDQWLQCLSIAISHSQSQAKEQ